MNSVNMQMRALHAAKVKRITHAWVKDEPTTVPIEACWLLKISSDDIESTRAQPGFVPTTRYGKRRWRWVFEGEIGANGGLRIVVDSLYAGPPWVIADAGAFRLVPREFLFDPDPRAIGVERTWDCSFCKSRMAWRDPVDPIPAKCHSCGAPRRAA